MIDQTWPFSPGEEGGLPPHSPLFLSNEREAKPAASFDPDGIKNSVAYGSRRITAVCFSASAGEDVQLSAVESEAGSVHGGAGRSDSRVWPSSKPPAPSARFDHQRHHSLIKMYSQPLFFLLRWFMKIWSSATISCFSL